MNDDVTILRNRLRDHLKGWLAGHDRLKTLDELYQIDPANAFRASPEDHLIIELRKKALREHIAKLDAKTELVPVWQDIIRELILEECGPLSPNNQKNAQTEPPMETETLPSPSRKPGGKRSVAITVALIGLLASVISAVIAAIGAAHATAQKTAESAANAAIQAFQERVSGGTIDADMNQKEQVGRDFIVGKQGVGLFRIQFRPPFLGANVVAVAAPHKHTVPTLTRIETHDGGSILVGIHRVSDDALVDAPFSFYVLEAVPVKP